MKKGDTYSLFEWRCTPVIITGQYLVLCENSDFETVMKFAKEKDTVFLHPVDNPFKKEDSLKVNNKGGCLHIEIPNEHSLTLGRVTSMDSLLVKSKKGSLQTSDLMEIRAEFQLSLIADLLLRKQVSCLKTLMKDIPLINIRGLNELEPCEGVKEVYKALSGK